MPQIVTQKCGFNETVDEMFAKIVEGQQGNCKMLQTFMNKTILEKVFFQSEINFKNNEITKLHAELIAASNLKARLESTIKITKEQCDMSAKNSQDRCDSQIAIFKDLKNKLEKQFNKKLSAKTQDLRETVDLKTSEIEKLLAELQLKTKELNKKDLKIKILVERMNIFDCLNNQW